MRTLWAGLVVTAALLLGGCRSSEREDPAARKMGRAAYHVTQDAEKAAKKAGQELRKATHELHEGWKDAKTEDKAKHR